MIMVVEVLLEKFVYAIDEEDGVQVRGGGKAGCVEEFEVLGELVGCFVEMG